MSMSDLAIIATDIQNFATCHNMTTGEVLEFIKSELEADDEQSAETKE